MLYENTIQKLKDEITNMKTENIIITPYSIGEKYFGY